MGDLAVAALRQENTTGGRQHEAGQSVAVAAMNELGKIATPHAAIALTPFLWDANQAVATGGAWQLAHVLRDPKGGGCACGPSQTGNPPGQRLSPGSGSHSGPPLDRLWRPSPEESPNSSPPAGRPPAGVRNATARTVGLSSPWRPGSYRATDPRRRGLTAATHGRRIGRHTRRGDREEGARAGRHARRLENNVSSGGIRLEIWLVFQGTRKAPHCLGTWKQVGVRGRVWFGGGGRRGGGLPTFAYACVWRRSASVCGRSGAGGHGRRSGSLLGRPLVAGPPVGALWKRGKMGLERAVECVEEYQGGTPA